MKLQWIPLRMVLKKALSQARKERQANTSKGTSFIWVICPDLCTCLCFPVLLKAGWRTLCGSWSWHTQSEMQSGHKVQVIFWTLLYDTNLSLTILSCFKNPSYNVFSWYSIYGSVREICTYSGAQCSAMQTDKTRYACLKLDYN